MFSIGVRESSQAGIALRFKVVSARCASAPNCTQLVDVRNRFSGVFLDCVEPAILAVSAGVCRSTEVSCRSHEAIVGYGSEGEKSTGVLFVSVFVRRTKVL